MNTSHVPLAQDKGLKDALAHLSCSKIVKILRDELEDARTLLEDERAAKPGTLDSKGPRPREEAFRQAVARFSTCLLDGIIPPEFLKFRGACLLEETSLRVKFFAGDWAVVLLRGRNSVADQMRRWERVRQE